ncbi:uncharacterized protein LOC103312668 [Tribolium castaneum]|uniref:Protein TsetseEP domain-containing protein n=1 Tax=Tribolium castaneum TaxID=7070 RepID=D1ZZS6_TRICA|nr:PREDICTED: uncharacterized protein LOC103312668 [Tribolium castaneum]EFA02412.1 hypothetical protein TcasGA2_TC008097 [Tribolium castaneum]|eukprot:XP_008192137.1 PREDICTED: uncharacterized protein LOC103312668 [Tribolium castaneum]
MLKFLLLLVIFDQAVCSVEVEVLEHLKTLQDQIDQPISACLKKLTTQFEMMAANFTNYQSETSEIIDSHTQSISSHLDSIRGIFTDFGIDIIPCEEIIQDDIDQIFRSSSEEVTRVLLFGFLTGRRVVSDAKNMFTLVQNKTVEIRLSVEDCMSMLSSDGCLIEVLSRIILLQYTLPEMIESVVELHEEQMLLIEEDVISGLEKIIYRVTNSYRDVMNDFVVCTLKYL